jgi:hypothetical protein
LSVWYCIPSKRPAEEVAPLLRKWKERGYKIALWTDSYAPGVTPQYSIDELANIEMQERPDKYPGYPSAVNQLVAVVMRTDWGAEWFVTGGDDVLPDPNHSAEEIAKQCFQHFGCNYGVMQPTGDRDFGDAQGPYIDRVAGSPWMGRTWCGRINQGHGPLWPEYFHMGEDEELQQVAIKYGVFWQRPDLIHRHNHWGRPREGEKMGQAARMPKFLERANSPEEWRKYKQLFGARQTAGFPGSEPL